MPTGRPPFRLALVGLALGLGLTGAVVVSGTVFAPAMPTPAGSSAALHLVGRLVHLAETVHCGRLHFGAVAEYTDLTVLSGTYTAPTIFVVQGCPEMPRNQYAEGSGDLEIFRGGDYHELHLTQQNLSGVAVQPGNLAVPAGGLYFCQTVNRYPATAHPR